MVVAVCEVISWTAILFLVSRCLLQSIECEYFHDFILQLKINGTDILIVIATSMYHDMKLMYQDMKLMYHDMVHKFHVLVQRLRLWSKNFFSPSHLFLGNDFFVFCYFSTNIFFHLK